MNYEEILNYLYVSTPAFHKVGDMAYKPGLDNTRALLSHIGQPHQHFRSIHVAGTNGKGSTSHLLASVLQSAGYKVGLYTSPHLVDYRERIRINGAMIPKAYVVEFVERHHDLLEQIRPSFFETTMALAFDYFASEQVDVAVVEVGLGGRLDSTNILLPELSVITNIGFDHTEYLGDTLEQIAGEKAGIIKPNTPVVIGERDDITDHVFLEKARINNAPIYFASEQEYADIDRMIDLCPLKGIYQQCNIRTVLCAVSLLSRQGWTISCEAISQGISRVLEQTALQGRWQQMAIKNHRVILDTGHNSHGIRYVARQLQEELLALIADAKLRIVFGMVSDKDVETVLTLMPQEATYYFTQAQTKRAIAAQQLSVWAAQHGLQGVAIDSTAQAVRCAMDDAAADDLIFIGGSNYVVGEALEYLQNNNI